MSIEKLNTRLYPVENRNGESNKKDVLAIKDFHEEIEKADQHVVATILQGSRFKGYSADFSDIDISLLYDSKGLEYNSSKYWELGRKIEDDARTIKRSIQDTKNTSNIQFLSFDINPDVIRKHYLPKKRFREISQIFSAGFGNKLIEYRKYWINYINNLSRNTKDEFIDNIINELVETEIERYMVKKIIPDAEKRQLLKTNRYKLWKNKLLAFGLLIDN